MSADLEETVKELGPEYRGVVDRLRAAATAAPEAPVVHPPLRRIGWWAAGALVAASLALVCLLMRPQLADAPAARDVPPPRAAAPAAAPARKSPYVLALSPSRDDIAEIIRTQSPDGSWQNDYLTRQNAAALRSLAPSSIAYRKAVRYLRTKGLAPLTDDELRSRGRGIGRQPAQEAV